MTRKGLARYTYLIAIAFTLLILYGIWTLLESSKSSKQLATKAVFFSSPPCGCCDTYLPKLRSIITVEVKSLPPDELLGVKKNLGIPENLQSCHTVVINGKYVEGHVPISAVKRLINGGFGEGVVGLALPHRETDAKTWEGPGYYIIFKNGTIWRVYS